jgi:FkbM family methyltransferase
MTHHGHVIYLMPQDTDLTPSILLSGWWEPHVENALVSLLQPGNIAIDVGCNIGYHTLVIASAVGPNGRVYAFEPNPLLQPLLYATLHGNRFPWVSVIAKAALDRDGEVELATDPSHYGSGCIVVGPESDYGPKFSIRADVPATIIDEELNGVDHVDLIHLDIEGAEPLALRGAAKLIERSPTVKIVAEWAVGMMNVRADVQDFVKWLADRGFSLQVIEPSGKFTPVSYEETLYLPECDVLLTR